MDYHVAPDCAISHSIHSPVSRETYPVCKLADVGYCMERLEFTPIEPRTWTMWWLVEKKRKSIIHLRLVPATLCLFPRCVDVCMYIHIYILVSLPRADIIVVRVLETDASKGNKSILPRREKFLLFKSIVRRINEFSTQLSSVKFHRRLFQRLFTVHRSYPPVDERTVIRPLRFSLYFSPSLPLLP